jgi:hypothetical protein
MAPLRPPPAVPGSVSKPPPRSARRSSDAGGEEGGATGADGTAARRQSQEGSGGAPEKSGALKVRNMVQRFEAAGTGGPPRRGSRDDAAASPGRGRTPGRLAGACERCARARAPAREGRRLRWVLRLPVFGPDGSAGRRRPLLVPPRTHARAATRADSCACLAHPSLFNSAQTARRRAAAQATGAAPPPLRRHPAPAAFRAGTAAAAMVAAAAVRR